MRIVPALVCVGLMVAFMLLLEAPEWAVTGFAMVVWFSFAAQDTEGWK